MSGPDADAVRVTVWYDGACPLCVAEIALMRRLAPPHAVRFVAIQSGETCPLAPEDLLARFHAQERGQPVVSGAAAFAALWRAIPILSPLGAVARVPAILWMLERAYRLFLRVRPMLQRCAHVLHRSVR